MIITDSIKRIADPLHPDREITIRNPGEPGKPTGKLGDITICHKAECTPPDDPRAPCECDAFIFELVPDAYRIRDWTITRRKGFPGLTVAEIVEADPEHRADRLCEEREQQEWSVVFAAVDSDEKRNVGLEFGARSLANMFDLAPEHARGVAEVFYRCGESYDPGYGTFGVIACNLGDPNLEAIEAAGWPLGMLDTWLRHDARRCGGCELCERMDAFIEQLDGARG